MESSLRHDVRQLFLDVETVQADLEALERDHAPWARQHHQEDLGHLIEHVNGLEWDVMLMISDCVAPCHQRQEKGGQQVLDRLHNALWSLDGLFNDLKNARVALNDSSMHPGELQHLAIDWGTLGRFIDQIWKFLTDREKV